MLPFSSSHPPSPPPSLSRRLSPALMAEQRRGEYSREKERQGERGERERERELKRQSEREREVHHKTAKKKCIDGGRSNSSEMQRCTQEIQQNGGLHLVLLNLLECVTESGDCRGICIWTSGERERGSSNSDCVSRFWISHNVSGIGLLFHFVIRTLSLIFSSPPLFMFPESCESGGF